MAGQSDGLAPVAGVCAARWFACPCGLIKDAGGTSGSFAAALRLSGLAATMPLRSRSDRPDLPRV